MNHPVYTNPVKPVKRGKLIFKSQLEANWAKFFTAAGIEWEYEPKTFYLPKLGPYTPDFRIVTGRGPAWLEVKPEYFIPRMAGIDEKQGWVKRLESLCQHTKEDVALLSADKAPRFPECEMGFLAWRYFDTPVSGDGDGAGNEISKWFGRGSRGFPNVALSFDPFTFVRDFETKEWFFEASPTPIPISA